MLNDKSVATPQPSWDDYFRRVLPTYIEQWPAALCRLSVAQADVPLSLQEAGALGRNLIELGCYFDGQRWGTDLAGVRERVTAALGKFPFGAFARLGSRSPKDSWRGHREGFKLLQGQGDPLRYFLDVSERVCEDLALALRNQYAPHIWVRQWLDIPAWSEFRCFAVDRRLVGVSQYEYGRHRPELLPFLDLVPWAVKVFFEDHFRRASHLDTVVFDVVVKAKQRGNEREAEVILLEINPSFEMTDPCLFDWRAGDFDGTFRYVDASRKVIRKPL